MHATLLVEGLLQDRAAHVSAVHIQSAGCDQTQLGLFGQHLGHAGFVTGNCVLRDDGDDEVRRGLSRLTVLILDSLGNLPSMPSAKYTETAIAGADMVLLA